MNTYLMIKRTLLAALLVGPLALIPAADVRSAGETDDAAAAADHRDRLCSRPGNWIAPGSDAAVPRTELLDTLSKKRVVLLGESHDNADHHRWQLQTLSALHGRVENLVIGFEMFPRRVQPVLDRWIEGELSEEAFLSEVEWRRVWGFDAGLYMPLFQFARQNRVPIVALNVERTLVAKVGRGGWDAVPESEREGITDPLAASDAYRHELAKVYLQKRRLAHAAGDGAPAEPGTAEFDRALEEIKASDGFGNFVAAQLTWDRAMAQKLAEAADAHPGAMVAGIIGSGHLSRFHGVPHQLADLGIADSAVLIPVAIGEACKTVATDLADAVFTIDTKPGPKKAPPMRLGVMIRDDDGAVRILEIVPDSVAAASELKAGDRIKRAAGRDITEVGELQKVVTRQAPGTWLPLVIERDGKDIDVVAKFGHPGVE